MFLEFLVLLLCDSHGNHGFGILHFQGLTPLHLAAQSGYDNAIEQLISDFGECVCVCVCVYEPIFSFNLTGANVNVRDHGGRRPIDILNNKANERARCKHNDLLLVPVSKIKCSNLELSLSLTHSLTHSGHYVDV